MVGKSVEKVFPGDVGAAGGIDGDPEAGIFAATAEVGRVDEARPVRGEPREEGVVTGTSS